MIATKGKIKVIKMKRQQSPLFDLLKKWIHVLIMHFLLDSLSKLKETFIKKNNEYIKKKFLPSGKEKVGIYLFASLQPWLLEQGWQNYFVKFFK